jgi:hypothetical protein
MNAARCDKSPLTCKNWKNIDTEFAFDRECTPCLPGVLKIQSHEKCKHFKFFPKNSSSPTLMPAFT